MQGVSKEHNWRNATIMAKASFYAYQNLGAFQKEFAAIREQLDELDLANNVQNRGKAQSLINNFQDRIKYYEEATGSELPRLGLGTADRYYSAERLMDIAKERNIGEKRSNGFFHLRNALPKCLDTLVEIVKKSASSSSPEMPATTEHDTYDLLYDREIPFTDANNMHFNIKLL